MKLRVLAPPILASLAGCLHSAAQDYYDRIEDGSQWQLAFEPRPISSSFDRCPSFASRTLSVPRDDGSHCDTGCTCGLKFQLEEDEGFLGSSGYVDVFFDQRCKDGSYHTCFGTHPELGLSVECDWFARTADAQINAYADCAYRLSLEQIAP
jgi:hypothetical protein